MKERKKGKENNQNMREKKEKNKEKFVDFDGEWEKNKERNGKKSWANGYENIEKWDKNIDA